MSSIGNQSTLAAQVWSRIAKIAYGVAMGKDGMAESANDLFRLAMTDVETDSGVAKAYYLQLKADAISSALANGKPCKLSEQNDKSRDTQISKLGNFPALGFCARANDAVEPAFEYARAQCEGGYTKLVACGVAMKKCLAKDARADEPTLMDAVDKALVAKRGPLASEEVRKMGEALAKLVHGDEKTGPSVHEPSFVMMLARYPADYAERARAALETLATCLEAIEADAAAKALGV
jgi:hypothetical protein